MITGILEGVSLPYEERLGVGARVVGGNSSVYYRFDHNRKDDNTLLTRLIAPGQKTIYNTHITDDEGRLVKRFSQYLNN